ncbi:MAG: peroxisomal 3,2-trans-enoyl-CoA isomerase [Myxococcota bacterium]|jgi:peroxisomal 3,2-trans-enoyl-CoA isomerase
MATDLILADTDPDGITTLTMNMPARLNGWTAGMLAALYAALDAANESPATKAIILTGADPYYCAGVNLGAAFSLAHPKTLHRFIATENAALFNRFIDLDKPIIIAVNGPALGASVTSAVLCDAIIASENASFSTPFAALGATPEGCSSVTFPRIIGDAAPRMLGEEGWKPTGAEAVEIGLADRVVPHEALLDEAKAMARGWLAEGRGRTFRGGFTREELKAVNATESQALASAFLHPRFLSGRFKFFWRKKKRGTALMFLALWLTSPVWSLLL